MRRRPLLLGLGTLLLTGLLGCDVTSPKTKDPVTQPTSLPGATALLIGPSDFTADITSDVTAGSATWYRLSVVKDSVYCVSVEGLDGTDTRLTVLSGTTAAEIGTNDDTRDYDPQVTFKASADGVVRIRVEGTDADAYGDFNLHVDPSDRYESDDSPQTASLIGSDGSLTRRILIGNVDDKDWMKVRTQAGVEYTLNCDEYTPSFYFYSSSSSSGGNTGYSLSSTYTSAGAGGYNYTFVAVDTLTFIKAYKLSGSYNATVYRVSVTKTPGDKYEPDNAFTTASLIATDSTIQARTITETNDDYVKFPAVKGRIYKVAMSSNNDVYTRFYQNDTVAYDGSMTSYSSSSDESTKLVQAGSQGFIYLRIESYNDGSGSYQLAVVELPADTTEPDNNLATATTLTVGTTTVPHFLSETDVDWYKFSADSGKTYTVSHPQLDLYYPSRRFWNSDSTLVSALQTDIGGYEGDGFYCTKSGTYYYSMSSSDLGNYTTLLEVSATTPTWFLAPDAFEPDNQMSTATTLKSDSTEAAHSLFDGDQDWTKMALDSGRTYFFDVKNLGSNSLSYSLFSDDSAALVAIQNLSYWSVVRFSYTARRNTNVYARITASATTKYTLRVWPAPVDSFESDDGLATAKPLATDGSAQIHTMFGTDDWMKVAMDSARPYSFQLDNRGVNASLFLEVYGADSVRVDGSSSYSANSGSSLLRTYTPTKAGTYYARVMVSTYYKSELIPYAISVKAAPVDSFESDNSLASAKPISVDGKSQYRMLSTGNEDWVSFSVDSGATYAITAQSLGLNDYVAISLYNGDSAQIGSFDYGLAAELTAVGRRKTTYYIRIVSQYAALNPFGYTLSVKATLPVVSGP